MGTTPTTQQRRLRRTEAVGVAGARAERLEGALKVCARCLRISRPWRRSRGLLSQGSRPRGLECAGHGRYGRVGVRSRSEAASDPERDPNEPGEGGQGARGQQRQDHCFGEEGEAVRGLFSIPLAGGGQGHLAVVDRHMLLL
jgi:hypothetical protein